MDTSNDQLRTALDRTFEPPIDVLIDPSLLVATRSLGQVADSSLFASQTQATLGGVPTEPRLGDLYVPETFRDLIAGADQSTAQQSTVWDFYRGHAETALREDIVEILDENDVESFGGSAATDDLDWANAPAFDTLEGRDRLLSVLDEERAFLIDGGLVMSRTASVFVAFRDAGVPTVDLGRASLVPELQATLSGVGYGDPASICGFAVSTGASTIDAVGGSVLARDPEMLLYRVGS